MRVPSNTYRLQITPAFDLQAATERLDYLRDLGVDWVYLSPLLEAEPGSTHGYDVVNPHQIDPARGGDHGFAAFSRRARELGLGVLVDIVPNHMGVATAHANPWWWDLLVHGPTSTYAEYFDVDWPAGDDKVLLPVVGDDDLRSDGSIANLQVVDNELRYHDNRYPIAPHTQGTDPNLVHAAQHYRLISWREGDRRLNYRRFFSITTLAAIRVEDPRVFADAHKCVRAWFDDGLVDGLRIDHPDGLRDPQAYLDDVAQLTNNSYVLVEKILEPGEELPAHWSTQGTTGYDALSHIDRVLTDPAGEEPLQHLDDDLRGDPVDWATLTHARKRVVADTVLAAETARLVRELLAATDQRDEATVTDVVAELLASFDVYRTYLPDGNALIQQAVAAAAARRPDLGKALITVGSILAKPSEPAAQRFQQTSGMVMAKGVEDNSFYRWARLTSLNEVGGDPAVFSSTPQDFHAWAAQRQRQWPHAMTCLTTHDTKRSEDTRSRITALAEVPDSWSQLVRRLHDQAPMPDGGFANLLWQAVVGAWEPDDPQLRDRLHAYAEKAMREAGDHTTWTEVDSTYETAVHDALDRAFDRPDLHEAITDFVAEIAPAAQANSLAAKLLALTMPGVPDVYQGTELPDHSLVDPDNRRPVDFDARTTLLTAPGAPIKFHLTRTALRLRRDHPGWFVDYRPLEVSGPAAAHALAYSRGGAVGLATRLPRTLHAAGGWADTTLTLPAGVWTDTLTSTSHQGTVALAVLLQRHPIALLTKESA